MAMVTSLVGVLMYVVSMQDVEARRFTSYNSVYLLSFGYAAYCSMAGAIIFILNFVVSIPMVILTFAWNRQRHGRQARRMDDRLDVDAVRDLLSGNKSHNSQPMYVVQADPIRNYYDDNDVQRQHFNQQQPHYPISPYTSGHTTSQV